jgi:hypothetical protein
MIYHIDKKEGDDNNRETFLLIEKNRDGRLGYNRMDYQPEYMLFREARDQQIPKEEGLMLHRYYLSRLTPSKWQLFINCQ